MSSFSLKMSREIVELFPELEVAAQCGAFRLEEATIFPGERRNCYNIDKIDMQSLKI